MSFRPPVPQPRKKPAPKKAQQPQLTRKTTPKKPCQ